MKKLKNILAENMRRFHTKNLLENADRSGKINIDGETYYVEVYIGTYTKNDVAKIAKETGLSLPTTDQAIQLKTSLLPITNNAVVGKIWVNSNNNYELYDLRNKPGTKTIPTNSADAIVLLGVQVQQKKSITVDSEYFAMNPKGTVETTNNIVTKVNDEIINNSSPLFKNQIKTFKNAQGSLPLPAGTVTWKYNVQSRNKNVIPLEIDNVDAQAVSDYDINSGTYRAYIQF
jgi:hypothetical protein